MKIGILLTNPKAEKKKDELVKVNSRKRPWARSTPRRFTILRDGKRHIPGDVSIGQYIMWNYPDIEIDFY